jgi:Lipase (class 3)
VTISPALLQRLPTLALASYSRTSWTIFDQGSGIKAALTDTDEGLVVAIPGTDPTSWQDIEADIADIVPHDDPFIGTVGRGIYMRAAALWHELRNRVPERWVVTGHSLGGAIAHQVTALAANEGKAPRHCMTFAAPRSLWRTAALKVACVDGVDFARFGDEVPNLPDWLGMQRPREVTMLGDPVDMLERLDLLRWHAMSGYEVLARGWMAGKAAAVPA